MSTAPFAASGGGKKAVHVKWAGKTIALGTFPAAEADEKCARAKALTRAWRSTMRPKPSRDWVMVELERLGVRVVSGRLGRKAGEEGEDSPDPKKMGGMPGMDRNPSMGLGGDMDFNNFMARRNSSLGLSMMNDMNRRGSLGSLGQVINMDGDAGIPPHRPMVGGGAAAAYEASRHDHYTQKSAEQQRRTSLGLGNLAGGGLGNMGMSVNPNQHYEMLKLHHMNLLNEIQETTLMMNLYQQQQLQQQQQHLQQQAGSDIGAGGSGAATGGSAGGDMASMGMMGQTMQNGSSGGMDHMFQQQRASLGLGPSMGNGAGAMSSQFPIMPGQIEGGAASGVGHPGMPATEGSLSIENRLAKLQEDIANRTKSGDGSDSKPAGEDTADAGEKREAEQEASREEPPTKKVKQEEQEEEKEGEKEEEDEESK